MTNDVCGRWDGLLGVRVRARIRPGRPHGLPITESLVGGWSLYVLQPPILSFFSFRDRRSKHWLRLHIRCICREVSKGYSTLGQRESSDRTVCEWMKNEWIKKSNKWKKRKEWRTEERVTKDPREGSVWWMENYEQSPNEDPLGFGLQSTDFSSHGLGPSCT